MLGVEQSVLSAQAVDIYPRMRMALVTTVAIVVSIRYRQFAMNSCRQKLDSCVQAFKSHHISVRVQPNSRTSLKATVTNT